MWLSFHLFTTFCIIEHRRNTLSYHFQKLSYIFLTLLIRTAYFLVGIFNLIEPSTGLESVYTIPILSSLSLFLPLLISVIKNQDSIEESS